MIFSDLAFHAFFDVPTYLCVLIMIAILILDNYFDEWFTQVVDMYYKNLQLSKPFSFNDVDINIYEKCIGKHLPFSSDQPAWKSALSNLAYARK